MDASDLIKALQKHLARRGPSKYWLQVHGVGTDGQVAIRRKLRRSEVLAFFQSLPPCLVGVEAVRQRTIGH